MCSEILQTAKGFVYGRTMAHGTPPHDEMGLCVGRKPLGLAAIDLGVDRIPDEVLQAPWCFPYGHIDQKERIIGWTQGDRVVSAVIGQPPDEPGGPLRQGIDRIEGRHESGQGRALRILQGGRHMHLSELGS